MKLLGVWACFLCNEQWIVWDMDMFWTHITNFPENAAIITQHVVLIEQRPHATVITLKLNYILLLSCNASELIWAFLDGYSTCFESFFFFTPEAYTQYFTAEQYNLPPPPHSLVFYLNSSWWVSCSEKRCEIKMNLSLPQKKYSLFLQLKKCIFFLTTTLRV